MAEKPSYFALLNGVSQAESRAHCYFTAWADVTPSDDVRSLLRTIATREGEHGMAFAKRVDELGFSLEPREDAKFENQMAVASSTELTDLEKMEQLGIPNYFVDEGPDLFDKFFGDHTIDIQTGELLGRYICEERDTIRKLKECYTLLHASANGNGKGAATAAASAADLRSLEAKVDALCQTVEQLCEAVKAPTAAGNAKKK